MFSKLGFAAIVLSLVEVSAWAQADKNRPAFEVAVVKPVDQARMGPESALGMKVTGQQVAIRLPLEALLEIAYDVTQSQIEGPDWLRRSDGNRLFDVAAKMPEGSTEAQVPLMLQVLLEERFKATISKSSKQASILALVVGKDGPKFKKKNSATESDAASKLDISVGSNGGGQLGGAKISQGPNREMKIEAPNPAALIFLLSRLLQPVLVVDKTGLQGTYDIKAEIASWQGGPATTAEDFAQLQKDAVMQAVSKIGLKLEPQKSQVNTIVVDRMETMPIEN